MITTEWWKVRLAGGQVPVSRPTTQARQSTQQTQQVNRHVVELLPLLPHLSPTCSFQLEKVFEARAREVKAVLVNNGLQHVEAMQRGEQPLVNEALAEAHIPKACTTENVGEVSGAQCGQKKDTPLTHSPAEKRVSRMRTPGSMATRMSSSVILRWHLTKASMRATRPCESGPWHPPSPPSFSRHT